MEFLSCNRELVVAEFQVKKAVSGEIYFIDESGLFKPYGGILDNTHHMFYIVKEAYDYRKKKDLLTSQKLVKGESVVKNFREDFSN